jgi:hypothetical protein
LRGVALCRAANYQRQVRAIPDGTGGALATWHDTRTGISGGPAEIYAQHVLGDGTLAPGWPADGVSVCDGHPCTLDSSTESGTLAPDEAGGMFVAWPDLRNGTTPDLYAVHLTGSGTPVPGWPAGGLPVSTAPVGDYLPTLQADGAGGCFLAWARNGYTVLTRLGGDGAPLPGWTMSGMQPFCAVYSPGPIGLAAQTDGVIIVGKSASSSGAQQDVYAARVGDDATPTSAPPAAIGDPGRLTVQVSSPLPAGAPATIWFTLPTRASVRIEIFDIAGRRVRSWRSDAALDAGTHESLWDGRDGAGTPVVAGVYVVRVEGAREVATRSFVRLR